MGKFAKIFLTSMFAIIAIASVRVSLAADIVDVNFPCPSGNCAPPADLPSYINTIYQFALGISGLLALGMIVAGGVYYTVSAGNSGRQGDAKSMITSAIWGLVLLFGSYLILNTINPQITKMGLNFSSATPPESQQPNQPLVSSTECPKFSAIAVNPSLSGITTSAPTCQFRKNGLTSDVEITQGNKYYSLDYTVFIKNGSAVWTYPYYLKSEGILNAQCLIFAYREQNSSSTTFVGLNNDLSLCPLQEQNSSICSEWTFTATGRKDAIGILSTTPIKIVVPVSKNDFNYPDPNKPPTITQDASNFAFLHQVVPGYSECTTIANPLLYCVNAQWTCTKTQ
jgi:hypothetical protein